MKKSSLLMILAIFLFASCNKKDKVLSKTEMLTTGTWKITAMVEDNDGNGSFETDAYAILQACEKDNFFSFGSNAQFVLDEGPTKCDATDPQTDAVSWQLMNNETKIDIDGSLFDIDFLNNSTLRIKEVYPGLYGVMITFTKR